MKCFDHQKIDAVGLCRYCFKGLCNECASEFEDGIACKGRCEEKAKDVASLVQYSVNSKKGMKYGKFLFPGFAMLLGLLFAGYGIYCDNFFGFNTLAGLLFFLFGAFVFLFNAKILRQANGKNS